MAKYLGHIFLLVGASLQQKDPLKDFCRRFGSQSAVVDERLYLDGGLTNWNPIAQNPRNSSNTWLLWHDLTQSPDLIGVPPLHANLSKNASIPSVSGGSLWADQVNKRIFLYGGDYLDVTPNQPEVLSYDVVNDQWDSAGRLGHSIGSISWGGSVGISELGRGYVLGGWMSNNSVPRWTGGPVATSYLLEYDMISGDWLNSTGPNDIPKAEGTMVYLPASNAGVLVYFGGGVAPHGNETLVGLPMSTIYVYDIKSSEWYEQQAGGDLPDSRRRFCAGAAWAEDRSSYNIYIYGGLGFGMNATGFDDVYILSLPSFKWVKYWEGDDGGRPHHSLTCNVIHGGGQMLIIGGSFPLTDSCDSPSTWAVHNLDMGKQSGHPWVEYRLNITTYVVPPEILKVVGGSPSGGATARTPAGGFENNDLAVYFRQRAAIVSRTPTRSLPTATPSSSETIPLVAARPSPKGLSIGAIAGLAVGGTLIFVALILGAWFLTHRHRKNRQPPNPYLSSPTTHQYTNSTIPPASHYSSTQPHDPLPTPNSQLEAEPAPVELSTSRTDEILEVVSPKKTSFPLIHGEGALPQQGESYRKTNGNSPRISPHRGSFTSDGGSPVGFRPVLLSPQWTNSTIERPTRTFKNRTYYSP